MGNHPAVFGVASTPVGWNRGLRGRDVSAAQHGVSRSLASRCSSVRDASSVSASQGVSFLTNHLPNSKAKLIIILRSDLLCIVRPLGLNG